jgi:hypothetical protein
LPERPPCNDLPERRFAGSPCRLPAFSNPKMSLKTGYQAGIDLLSFFEF